MTALNLYNETNANWSIKMNLINIFEDTLNNLPKHSSNTKKFFYDPNSDKKLPSTQNIIIEELDTVSSLLNWSKKGKTCILNMASYINPGGGVERGAKAQEECLCRCSTLFPSLEKNSDKYPLEINSALYTTNVIFFKDFYYNYIQPSTVDVISIAAINLNTSHIPLSRQEKNYKSITKNKIKLMCYLPAKYNVENLILGAWGCGAFKNDPNTIAKYFKEILIDNGYSSLYKNVIFAIINDHHALENNLEIFKTYLDFEITK